MMIVSRYVIGLFLFGADPALGMSENDEIVPSLDEGTRQLIVSPSLRDGNRNRAGCARRFPGWE